RGLRISPSRPHIAAARLTSTIPGTLSRRPAIGVSLASPRSLTSVAPPALLDLRVPRAGVWRTDRDQLDAFGAGLEPTRRLLRDAYRIPLLQLDDLVLELDPHAPVDDEVDLLLGLVPVAERNPEVRRQSLVADPGVLELERHACHPGLEVGSEAEV